MLLPRRLRRQRGVASLLFVLIASVGLVATTMGALYTSKGAQKIQYAQHTSAQAQMNAWTGVNAISSAIAAMSSAPTLTPGGAVQLAGLPSSIAATYVTTQNGFMIFDVSGSSRGATTTLRAAYAYTLPSTTSSTSGSYASNGVGMVLHGNTTMSGSTTYTGSAPANIYVIGGDLTLSGGTNGIQKVCATGDISMSGSASAGSVCTDGNLSMSGGSVVGTQSTPGVANVRGFVKDASVWGDINSNSWVTLSGSAIKTTTINATGYVTVDGSSLVDNVSSEGNVDLERRLQARSLTANGTVSYTPSGSSPSTDITARGNVTLTDARSVTTNGNTSLTGGSGLGIQGALNGAGSLNWSNSGAVVSSGTVGGAKLGGTGPNVKVTYSSGYTPAVSAFTMPSVVTFTPNNLVVDAYALKSQANFAFSVDAQHNVIVKVANINGVTDGTYFVAKKNTAPTSENWLCTQINSGNCSVPLVRICGVNGAPGSKCFAYGNGTWTLSGTMLPSVAWFQGDLDIDVGNSPSIATLIATGDIGISGGNDTYAPNFAGQRRSATARRSRRRRRAAASAVPSLTSLSMSANNYATQLCTSGGALTAATMANNALVAGGYSNNVYSGGNVKVSASTVLGSILAGDMLTTSGSSYVAGSLYNGALSGTGSKNALSGGSTISSTGASAAFNASVPTCLTNCTQASTTRPANNIVWVSPI